MPMGDREQNWQVFACGGGGGLGRGVQVGRRKMGPPFPEAISQLPCTPQSSAPVYGGVYSHIHKHTNT